MSVKLCAAKGTPSRFVHHMFSRPNLLYAAGEQRFMFQLNNIR